MYKFCDVVSGCCRGTEYNGDIVVVTGKENEAQLAELISGVRSEMDVSSRSRVFCNRNLKLESVEMIGFDMDYTLALYNQERMEQLSIELTLGKLIDKYNYPSEIRDLSYDSRYAVRGVVIDCKLGNVFKMDRHRYVGRVYHGKRLLDTDERHAQYRNSRIQLSQERYAWIDTLFGLPEAVMYITLVDYFDRRGSGPSYRILFDQIRASIDEAHRDDSLKSEIKANLANYVVRDPRLAECLHKLRSSGKKIFLLTNSYYAYTNAVMTYLLNNERVAYPSWRNYFDVIVVGGQKPRFFTEGNPFIGIDPVTGEKKPDIVTKFGRDLVYEGGNILAFEELTGVGGERVLYVGDHIYGDILRLKKSHVWRTAMVVQELEQQTKTSERLDGQIRDLTLLDRRRRNLESEIDFQGGLLKRLEHLIQGAQERGQGNIAPRLEEARQQAKKTLGSLRDRARLIAEEVEALEATIERAYNPYWGAIFREGNENSRFGEQVSDYADLYTSRASNFGLYSPLRYFRAPRRQMPHEL